MMPEFSVEKELQFQQEMAPIGRREFFVPRVGPLVARSVSESYDCRILDLEPCKIVRGTERFTYHTCDQHLIQVWWR